VTDARVPVLGPDSLIQGTIPADRRLASLARARRLEAVVLTAAGDALVHYHRDQTRPDRPWVRGETISEPAVGPGAIAQVPGRWREPGDLHVLVPEASEGTPTLGHHVRHAGAGRSHRWHRVGSLAGAEPRLWVADGRLRAEVVRGRAACRLVWDADGWRPDGGAERPLGVAGPTVDAVASALARTQLSGLPLVGDVASALPGGDRGLTVPTTASGGRGWWQALVQEGASVYQWHRQEWAGRVRWVRAACLRFDPGDGFGVAAEQSVKLAQVTGERDSQPARTDTTLSFSESRSGVRGTDLGVRVDHDGRTFLLFGDSHWTTPGRVTRDAIGLVTPDGPVPGLPGVELHGAPLAIVGGPATGREYDVPLDGFSFGGDLFVLFSSHHFARHQVMGRSLLTRAVDPGLPVSGRQRRRPIAFRHVGTFSDRFFVNVSVAREGERLWVWGSGSYRADDLRLAEFDLTSPGLADALLGRRRWARPQDGVRYWAGSDASGAPWWSSHEDAAASVLPGAFGELSVRWVEELGRFVLLAMDGPEDPIGPSVTMRTAERPWGPWTPRVRLFDWEASGKSHHDEASRFIRAHHDGDPVGDAVFGLQRSMTGAAYAPYLFDARREGGDVVLRYTLSTWNPYQVVLMEHRLASRGA